MIMNYTPSNPVPPAPQGQDGIPSGKGKFPAVVGIFVSAILSVGYPAWCQEPAPVGSLQELLNPYPIERIKPWRTLQSSSGLIDLPYDGGNFVRTEPGQRFVMLDVQGRGSLDRMWFVYIKDDPNLRKFDLLIYVDNDDQPTINTDLNDFIDGKREPYVEPLVGRCGFRYPHTGYFRPSRYWNAPIGFHKSLKMIIIPSDPNGKYGWRDFDDGKRRFAFMYQLAYRLCQPDVPVKVFTPKPDTADMAALAKIKTRWGNAGQVPWHQGNPEGEKKFETTLELQAGKSVTLWKHDAPGTLRELRIKLMPKDDSVAMRRRLADSLWLDMTWDHAEKPQVSVPLGVFFLAPDFATDIKAICVGCRNREYYSFLPMPFFKDARIQIRSTDKNPGTLPIAAKVRWTTRTPANDACLFHTRRYSQSNIPKGENILMLDTQGAGHVVGIVADHYHDVENDDCWYFDGEKTPSVYGTGTEDFFSFAWGLGDLQAMPLHGVRVPFGPPSKRGYRTDSGLAYRFHPFATYPFRKSLNLSWVRENIQKRDRGHYSGIVYYYLSPPK